MESRYCTIIINSAGTVTRDGPTEILVSAGHTFRRDGRKFSEKITILGNNLDPKITESSTVFGTRDKYP